MKDEFITPFALGIPTRLYCGVDSIKTIAEVCQNLGSKPLLVTARELVQAHERILHCLDQMGCTISTAYLDSPEPTCAFIDSLAQELRPKQYDCIIGLGGGSAIDTAKSLSIALTHTDPIWLYANLPNRPPLGLKNKLLPIVAIPTTSGTGAEVTPYAVLTNSETLQKGTIQQSEIFPYAGIVDPVLTQTMPLELTAATAIDAFAHALESQLNISKFSPVSEWAGREALRLIFENLSAVYSDPQNLDLRAKMAWASSLAGIAIGHRGTTAAHAIAEPLGALTHIPHGQCVAMCSLPVLRRTWQNAQTQLARLSPFHGLDTKRSDRYEAEVFLGKVEQLFESVKMKISVVDYCGQGKPERLAETLLENVLNYKFRPLRQHPIQFSREALQEMIVEIVGE